MADLLSYRDFYLLGNQEQDDIVREWQKLYDEEDLRKQVGLVKNEYKKIVDRINGEGLKDSFIDIPYVQVDYFAVHPHNLILKGKEAVDLLRSIEGIKRNYIFENWRNHFSDEEIAELLEVNQRFVDELAQHSRNIVAKIKRRQDDNPNAEPRLSAWLEGKEPLDAETIKNETTHFLRQQTKVKKPLPQSDRKKGTTGSLDDPAIVAQAHGTYSRGELAKLLVSYSGMVDVMHDEYEIELVIKKK